MICHKKGKLTLRKSYEPTSTRVSFWVIFGVKSEIELKNKHSVLAKYY